MKRAVHNILVTGGAGFIGSAFIRRLLTRTPAFKGTCTNLDLLSYAGNLENLKEISSDPRYLFQQGDICDQSLVERLCQEQAIDTIIHFAAESHVDRSIHRPRTFIETNILGTFHLLEVVRRHPRIHFHHVSTDEVYGSLGPTGLFTEETPYHPNSPYSASKASSDHLVRAYGHTYNLSTCISNCSNNYGPYQFPEKLIPLVILNCLEKKSIPVYGEGLNRRDWLHVDDHADALIQLLERGRKAETYNVGGEAECNNISLVHQIIDQIAEIKGEDPEQWRTLIAFVQDRPGHDQRYAIDCSKIKQELGWKRNYTLEKGLRETIRWYLENLNWVKHVQDGSYKEWLDLNYAGR
jgi:dTDP-glucose 4,6-dehydratase